MSFGKNHSQQQSQSTSQQTLDPQIKGALLGNYANAQNLVANTPSQYSGQLVAGFNPTQTGAMSNLVNFANSGVGNDALNRAASTYGNVAGYTPQQVSAGQLSQTDLSPYMNPYTKNVTDATMQQMEQARALANQGNDANATSAGAFGGDRSAVLDGITNGQYGMAEGQTLAGLNQANYSNAQGAAQSDIASKLAAAQGNQQAGLAGQTLNLNAGQGLQSLSGQQVSQGATLAGIPLTIGNQQQQQAQNVDTANQQNFQQNLGNTVTMQQLLNQALGLAGNPVLGSSQGTGSGSSWGMSFGAPGK